MATIKWLLEPDVFKGDLEPFVSALRKLETKHVVCKFGMDYTYCLKQFDINDILILQGSLQFRKTISEYNDRYAIPEALLHLIRTDGVFCNLEKLNCLYYYPRFKRYMLNDVFVILPLGSIIDNNWVINCLGNCNDWPVSKIFARPVAANKLFTGQLFTCVDFQREIKYPTSRMNPEDLILLSSPKTISKEWRLIVINNEVVAGSQYKLNDKIVRIKDVPQEVLDYGQEVVNNVKYTPDPAWVLDICETKGRLQVLEVGSFSCSGLYAADPETVILKINELFKD